MKNQIAALRVKIKGLAREAADIRREERKALGRNRPGPAFKPSGGPGGAKRPKRQASKYRDLDLYLTLRSHRTTEVRDEQRAALLAYAFLRGVPYRSVEPMTDWMRRGGWYAATARAKLWERVRSLVEKFGGVPGSKTPCLLQTLTEWEQKKAEAVAAAAAQ